ncbi:MAG: TonB family protein [Nonlabens sp.]
MFLTLTPVLGFSQVKLDTVYYDTNLKVVEDPSSAETYEIRTLNKRGKLNGIAKRFDRNDEVLESTTYVKGRKSGAYLLVQQDTVIRGEYIRDRKISLWSYEHRETGGTRIEMYNEKGEQTEIDPLIIDATALEIDASFPGGQKAWGTFLRNNLKYPEASKRANIQGQVILKFIITAAGYLKDIYVSSNPDQNLSIEALRVLKKSPRWIPKRVKGVAVESEMTLRIVFGLPNRR